MAARSGVGAVDMTGVAMSRQIGFECLIMPYTCPNRAGPLPFALVTALRGRVCKTAGSVARRSASCCHSTTSFPVVLPEHVRFWE